MLTPEKFVQYMTEIEKWNATARVVNSENAKELFIQQQPFVMEEIEETLKALNEDDTKEILDGAADILVTLGYKISLLNIAIGNKGYSEGVEEQSKREMYFMESQIKTNAESTYQDLLFFLEDALVDSNNIEFPESSDYHYFTRNSMWIARELFDFLKLVEFYTGNDLCLVIEDVLESNWSKFPKFVSEEVCKKEEEYILNNRKDVEFVISTVVGDRVVYFNQNQKIMKPSTFQDVDPSKWGL